MKKSFEKYEMPISISLIVIYLLSNSYCMNSFGLTNYKTVIVNFVLFLIIVLFIKKKIF